MRERKHEFSAWMVYEVAKTWAEADGDTAEAIDFCEFYGREMLRYGGEQPLVKVPGEDDHLEYIPLGVGRGYSALEFSARDHGRHDQRRFCDRQHGCSETFVGRADDRLQVFRNS